MCVRYRILNSCNALGVFGYLPNMTKTTTLQARLGQKRPTPSRCPGTLGTTGKEVRTKGANAFILGALRVAWNGERELSQTLRSAPLLSLMQNRCKTALAEHLT